MSESNTAILVAAICGLLVLVVFGWLVMRPAVSAYWRGRDKLAAAFLSLYALAAVLGMGAGLGVIVFYNWDRIGV